MRKIYAILAVQEPELLSGEELHTLQYIVEVYSKPKKRKEKKNEARRKTTI